MGISIQILRRLGLVPVLVFIAFFAFIVLSAFKESSVFNSPTLLLILNVLFLTGTGLVVAAISAKSYLTEGTISLLLLGMATAAGGIAALVAGLAAHLSINESTAIFNLGFLFSGALQLVSAITAWVGALPQPSSTRKLSFTVGYLSVIGFVVATSFLVISGFSPDFVVASSQTLTSQWTVGMGIALFCASSMFFGFQYLQSRSQVLYWYSLALALLAMALLGSALYTTPNGVIDWVGRFSLYLGGFYFLAAVIVTRSEHESGQVDFSEKWAEAFKSDPKQLDILFGKMLDGLAFHKIIYNAKGEPVDYLFLDVNQAFEEMTGLKKEKIVGKRATKVIVGTESDPADFINVYGHVALTGKSVRFENYSERLRRWFYVSAYSPKKDYFIALIEDITERKELEKKLEVYTKNLEALVELRSKELKDAERMAAIGATASMVGHDIRNPLQAITGDLYLLKEEIKEAAQNVNEQQMQESIDSIEENIAYINKIVSDLQDYTRPIKPNIEEINPKDTINAALKVIKVPSNVETTVTVQNGWTLRTDGAYLRRALTNLFNNAVQAMPNGGRLIVKAYVQKSYALICVEDTGVGISEDVKNKLFIPLFTTKSKGQGLGLAVVKRLIEGLNGKISVESQEGKGTEFTITLPLEMKFESAASLK